MKKKTQQCPFCKRFFKRVKGRHELFCTAVEAIAHMMGDL